jgi:predicted dehydrogenase
VARLGFLGVGWIGRARMAALTEAGAAEVAVVAEPDAELREAALAGAAASPGAREPAACESLEELLEHDLDGVVIATPSALHAEQSVAALARGLPVFCQKPLGRSAEEAHAVVDAARRADRLLGVDLSYRFTEAARALKEVVDAGALGHVYAVDLTFHNAYGPDKPWFRRRDLAGGGCLIDLGTHLIDLALWMLGAESARVLSAHVLREGRPLPPDSAEVEDHAIAELELDGGTIARLACSWWLPAGRDCVIEVALHGTEAGGALTNVGGSFYDLAAELRRGTTVETLASPADEWGGRAAVAWAERVARDPRFDRSADELVRLSALIDGVYEAAR